MIHENAVVVGVDGNQVEIDVQRQGSCGSCQLNKSCGVGVLARLFGTRSKPLVINSELNLKPGDHILLGIADQGLLSASILVYGLPLVGLLVVAVIVHLLSGGSELAVSVSSVVGFIGGLVLTARLIRKYDRIKMRPTILRINNEPIDRFKVIKSDSH